MAGNKAGSSLDRTRIITEYARMWPRDVFDYPTKGRKVLADDLTILQNAGVYVLYRDDVPYYIGKTDHRLGKRLFVHAKRPTSRYDYFWNHFSVFVIPDKTHRAIVESLLIAAMPTANSAKPKEFDRHKVPPAIIKMMRDQRRHKATMGMPSIEER
jgi:hypothetical protein